MVRALAFQRVKIQWNKCTCTNITIAIAYSTTLSLLLQCNSSDTIYKCIIFHNRLEFSVIMDVIRSTTKLFPQLTMKYTRNVWQLVECPLVDEHCMVTCFSRKVMGHYLAAVCRSEEHAYICTTKIIVRLCNVSMTAKLGSVSRVERVGRKVIYHLLCPAK